MRRKEREVTDFEAIFDILNRCDTVRIGIQGEEYPYVVPVSFGACIENGKIAVYFHCAHEGRKADLLEKNPQVCVEGDIFYKTEKTEHGVTTRYESIIGTGTAEHLADRDEKVRGLTLMTDHYGYVDYPVGRCSGLEKTSVYKITLSEVSGKRNLG